MTYIERGTWETDPGRGGVTLLAELDGRTIRRFEMDLVGATLDVSPLTVRISARFDVDTLRPVGQPSNRHAGHAESEPHRVLRMQATFGLDLSPRIATISLHDLSAELRPRVVVASRHETRGDVRVVLAIESTMSSDIARWRERIGIEPLADTAENVRTLAKYCFSGPSGGADLS